MSWDPERPHLPCAPRALPGPPALGASRLPRPTSRPTPPSAAPAGKLPGGRLTAQALSSRQGFLLRTQQHLGLLPVSSVSEAPAGHPLTWSWVQMLRCVLGGAGAERQVEGVGGPCRPSCQQEVRLQPSSPCTRHPPRGEAASCGGRRG